MTEDLLVEDPLADFVLADFVLEEPDEPVEVEDSEDSETPDPEDPRGRMITRWRSPLAPIGRRTGDGRRFSAGSLTNRDLPLPLQWRRSAESGHSSAVVVGTLDRISYAADGAPTGEGVLFTPDPSQLPRLAEDCGEVRHLIDQGVIGPSVDLDEMEYAEAGGPEEQYAGRPPIDVTRGQISAVTLVPIPAFSGLSPHLELWEVTPEELAALHEETDALTAAVTPVRTLPTAVAPADRPWDAGDAVRRIRAWAAGDPDKLRQAFLWSEPGRDGEAPDLRFPVADVIDGQLAIVPRALSAAMAVLSGARGGTVLPAADQAAMRRVISTVRRRTGAGPDAMVASAGVAPARPPAAWFDDPKLAGPTAMKVTPDGRVFGHVAPWGVCHLGLPGCETAPRSASNYAYFHTGEVLTAEDRLLKVGRLVFGTSHAPLSASAAGALDHYEHTGRQAAVVRAGEDAFGIWVAGALVPEADEETAALVRRSPPSGDWRRVGGALEMIAALSVNTPGFPPLARAFSAEGHTTALVASAAGLVEEVPDMRQLVSDELDRRTRMSAASAALAAMDDARDAEEETARRARIDLALARLG